MEPKWGGVADIIASKYSPLCVSFCKAFQLNESRTTPFVPGTLCELLCYLPTKPSCFIYHACCLDCLGGGCYRTGTHHHICQFFVHTVAWLWQDTMLGGTTRKRSRCCLRKNFAYFSRWPENWLCRSYIICMYQWIGNLLPLAPFSFSMDRLLCRASFDFHLYIEWFHLYVEWSRAWNDHAGTIHKNARDPTSYTIIGSSLLMYKMLTIRNVSKNIMRARLEAEKLTEWTF